MTNIVRVLLVEDNPNDIEVTLHAFKQNNFLNQVHVCRDGEEALNYLCRRGEYVSREFDSDPQVILLDLKLPKIDGLDVLRAIKADPALRYIPVVILTASSQDKDLIDTYDLGVNSYIVKPVDFDQFMTAVRTIGFYWALLNQTPEPIVSEATM